MSHRIGAAAGHLRLESFRYGFIDGIGKSLSKIIDRPVTGIVVLGGAVDTHVSVDRQTLAMNEAGERLTEAVDLSRRYPDARIFLSGGANHIISSQTTESQVARDILVMLGVPAQRIDRDYPVTFEEHDHGAHDHGVTHRDHNMRAAIVHVLADAAVSVMVIVGLLLARAFGWLWMDPLAAIVGAVAIVSWSWGLVRDTGAILLDMVPDRRIANDVRRTVEAEGDRVDDLHLWRLGPGHLGAIVSVDTARDRGPEFYRARLARFPTLSHVTVEVRRHAA